MPFCEEAHMLLSSERTSRLRAGEKWWWWLVNEIWRKTDEEVLVRRVIPAIMCGGRVRADRPTSYLTFELHFHIPFLFHPLGSCQRQS
jgi:hypothetical protein